MDGTIFLAIQQPIRKQIFRNGKFLEKKIIQTRADICIIDNLMALDIGDYSPRDKYEAQTNFVWALKELAQITNTHIIFVAHPRKANGFLRLSDISGSGNIANIVDNAFIIHRWNKDFENGYQDYFKSDAATDIGANGQLARTGALYHDIGKMENPAFFTENQGNASNPHKALSYEQSAQVVISHVTDGLKLAEKNNLPKVIRQFITTHHGAGKTKYFYISWKNEHPGEEPDPSWFNYPGPNPFTAEQAILMMADAVEAASRSLQEYTEESITQLVDKIIDAQVAEGYFNNCPITFQDIQTVKDVFKSKLKSMYHPRIKYPELK